MSPQEKLQRQIAFLVETERLKGIVRKVSPIGVPRYENSAEHSWTLALMAVLLSEHSDTQIDLLHVMKMLLIHDLVEIDAGDTFCFDLVENATKAEREVCAADRIFALLPDEQCAEFRALWEEFEARTSAEAVFANALDRLMPLLQNFHNNGGSWKEFGIRKEQAYERQRPIGEASTQLWQYAESILEEAERLNVFGNVSGR
ncbi:MAG: HD domain-containing protein [Chthoniobacterales bacterium]